MNRRRRVEVPAYIRNVSAARAFRLERPGGPRQAPLEQARASRIIVMNDIRISGSLVGNSNIHETLWPRGGELARERSFEPNRGKR